MMKKKSRKSSSRSLSKTNSPDISPRLGARPSIGVATGLVPPPPPSAFKDLKIGRKVVHYTSSSDLDVVITNRMPKNELIWRRQSLTRSSPGLSVPRGIHYRPREASIYTMNACPRVRLPPQSMGYGQSQKHLKGQGQGCKIKVCTSSSTSSQSLKSDGQRRRKKAQGKPPAAVEKLQNKISMMPTTSIQTEVSFAHLIVPPPPPLNITTLSSLNLSQPFRKEFNSMDSGDRQSYFQQGAKTFPNLAQKAATAQLNMEMQLQMQIQQQQQNQYQQQQKQQQQQFVSQIPSLPPLHNIGSNGDSNFVNQFCSPNAVGGSGDDFNYLNKMEQEKPGQIPFGNFLPQIPQQNFTVMPLHYNYFNNQNQQQQQRQQQQQQQQQPQNQQSQQQGQQPSFLNSISHPNGEQQRAFGGFSPRFNGFPFCPPPPPIDPEDFPSFNMPQYREFLNMNESLAANSARPFDEALRDEVRRRLLHILSGVPDQNCSTDGSGLFNGDSQYSGLYSNLQDNPGSLYDNLSNTSSFHSISHPIPPPPSSISKDSSKASVRAQNSKESYWLPDVYDKTKRIVMDTTKSVNKQLASDLPNYVVKNAKEAKKVRRPQPSGIRKIVDDAKGSKTTPLPKLIGGPGFGQVPIYIKRRKVEIQIEKFRKLESEWRDALLNLHEEARKWRKNQEEKRAKARQQARKLRNYQKMHSQQTLLVRDQVTGRLIHVPLSQCIGKHRDSAEFNSKASGKNGRESIDRMKRPMNSRFQVDNIFIGPYKNSSSTSLIVQAPESVKSKDEKNDEQEEDDDQEQEPKSKSSLKQKKKKSSGSKSGKSKKKSDTSTEQPEGDEEEDEVPAVDSLEGNFYMLASGISRRAISLPCMFPEQKSSETISFSSEDQIGNFSPPADQIEVTVLEELEDSMDQGDAEILHMNDKGTESSEEEVDDENSDDEDEEKQRQEPEPDQELDQPFLRRCKSANDL